MLIVLGLIFSSCDFIHYGKIAIQDNIRRIEMEREKKSVMKKDGPAAIDVDEYKEGVEEAIKDVLKRRVPLHRGQPKAYSVACEACVPNAQDRELLRPPDGGRLRNWGSL